MLEKIASISDMADIHGQYELANELDNFVKTAGIVDALWALINPKHYGLESDEKWMRRLQRGFLQGKLEKRLAKAMSKLIEVGRYERAIAEEAAPLKTFIDDITKVYENIFKPGANPKEIHQSLKDLRTALRGAQRNFSGSKLAKLVEKREKLVRDAIETMKDAKLPDEMKKKLIELTGNPALLEQIAKGMEEAVEKKKEEKKEESPAETIPFDAGRFLKKEEPKAEPKAEAPVAGMEAKTEAPAPAPVEAPKPKFVEPKPLAEVPAEMIEAPSGKPVQAPAPKAAPKQTTPRKPSFTEYQEDETKRRRKVPQLFPEGKSGFVSRKLDRLEKLADLGLLK